MYDVAVIGAGGAGQMALLRAVLNHLRTVVFLGDAAANRRSRATWVAEVENIPGMFNKKRPITATTKEVIQFIENRADLKPFLTLVRETAEHVSKDGRCFTFKTKTAEYCARFAVLCTGTMDVQPEIKGSIKPILPFANKEDVVYCIRCDGHKMQGKKCAVIGHRGAAGWIAVMLKERYDLPELSVLTHGKPFEGSDEVKALLQKYNIKVIEGEIEEVLGDPKMQLEGFRVGGKEVRASKAFVALGSVVYNDLAKQLGAKLSARDHVITDENGKTSVEGFYAAGDLVEGKKKQVYTAWDLAVDAVDDIDEKIRILKREGKY